MLPLLIAAALLAPYGEARLLLTFDDPRVSESSGLASSSRSDAVLFTHNDSGDDARFFAVDLAGDVVATYQLPGVDARDWEDMARGPDEQGRSSLFLADIGDNRATRERGVLVHRVPEPEVDVTAVGLRDTTPPPASFRLVYPDGPRDAETLLVHPTTGRLLVVTKELSGTSGVYAAPQPLDPSAPNPLELVAQVHTQRTGTPGGPAGSFSQRLVTAGDVSPDGTRVALRTYTDLYEWAAPDGDLVRAFAGEPVVTPLPSTDQGEALAYSRDGSAVVVSSEGTGAPVHRLERRAPGADEPPTAAGSGSEAGAEADDRRWMLPAAAGALLLVAAVTAALARTRRVRGRR